MRDTPRIGPTGGLRPTLILPGRRRASHRDTQAPPCWRVRRTPQLGAGCTPPHAPPQALRTGVAAFDLPPWQAGRCGSACAGERALIWRPADVAVRPAGPAASRSRRGRAGLRARRRT